VSEVRSGRVERVVLGGRLGGLRSSTLGVWDGASGWVLGYRDFCARDVRSGLMIQFEG
jgi:hypothetical protein